MKKVLSSLLMDSAALLLVAVVHHQIRQKVQLQLAKQLLLVQKLHPVLLKNKNSRLLKN